jgi:hypothetical protein
MDEIAKELRVLPVEGKIRFTISADNTEDNSRVHEAFKSFAASECGNNYTLALKTLLHAMESDFKYESLWDSMKVLQQEVADLRVKVDTRKETKGKEDAHDGVF